MQLAFSVEGPVKCSNRCIVKLTTNATLPYLVPYRNMRRNCDGDKIFPKIMTDLRVLPPRIKEQDFDVISIQPSCRIIWTFQLQEHLPENRKCWFESGCSDWNQMYVIESDYCRQRICSAHVWPVAWDRPCAVSVLHVRDCVQCLCCMWENVCSVCVTCERMCAVSVLHVRDCVQCLCCMWETVCSVFVAWENRMCAVFVLHVRDCVQCLCCCLLSCGNVHSTTSCSRIIKVVAREEMVCQQLPWCSVYSLQDGLEREKFMLCGIRHSISKKWLIGREAEPNWKILYQHLSAEGENIHRLINICLQKVRTFTDLSTSVCRRWEHSQTCALK
jgi:hypothetical protein